MPTPRRAHLASLSRWGLAAPNPRNSSYEISMSSTHSPFDLHGKVAVLVGGSGYLCTVLAAALRRAGAAAAIVDLNAPAGEADFVRCDVTSRTEVLNARDAIMARYGRVDILLNGAAANAPSPFFEIS